MCYILNNFKELVKPGKKLNTSKYEPLIIIFMPENTSVPPMRDPCQHLLVSFAASMRQRHSIFGGRGQQKSILFLRMGQVTILAARRIPRLPGVTPQRACMAAGRLWAVTQVTDSLRTRKHEAERSTVTLLLCLQKRVPWCPPTPNHRMPAGDCVPC